MTSFNIFKRVVRVILKSHEKEEVIKKIDAQIQTAKEQVAIQEKYQAAMDGECFWFDRGFEQVCIDHLERKKKNGKLPNNAPCSVGN
jgi:hypothetical protein